MSRVEVLSLKSEINVSTIKKSEPKYVERRVYVLGRQNTGLAIKISKVITVAFNPHSLNGLKMEHEVRGNTILSAARGVL